MKQQNTFHRRPPRLFACLGCWNRHPRPRGFVGSWTVMACSRRSLDGTNRARMPILHQCMELSADWASFFNRRLRAVGYDLYREHIAHQRSVLKYHAVSRSSKSPVSLHVRSVPPPTTKKFHYRARTECKSWFARMKDALSRRNLREDRISSEFVVLPLLFAFPPYPSEANAKAVFPSLWQKETYGSALSTIPLPARRLRRATIWRYRRPFPPPA